MAMSSTAVVSKLLVERMQLDSPHGREVMGVLLFQDLAVVPSLILIPALGGSAEQMWSALAIALVKAIVVLSVILFFGQRLMRNWFHVVAKRKSTELFMLNILLVTLGLAWVTELAGLSLALGAFVAGMLISETEYRYQVEEDIKPFRDVLMGLFFVTIGMLLDLSVVAYQAIWVAVRAGAVAGDSSSSLRPGSRARSAPRPAPPCAPDCGYVPAANSVSCCWRRPAVPGWCPSPSADRAGRAGTVAGAGTADLAIRRQDRATAGAVRVADALDAIDTDRLAIDVHRSVTRSSAASAAMANTWRVSSIRKRSPTSRSTSTPSASRKRLRPATPWCSAMRRGAKR